MLSYLQYLNLPTKVVMALVGVFFVMQIIGELLEFRGKAVPEYFKIRKYIKRKKDDREAMRQVPETLKEVRELLDNVNKHYSEDNITLRDQWIKDVNEKLETHDQWKEKFDEKLDRNNQITLDLLIDHKRDKIISFANRVIDEKIPVTREEYNRIFKLYNEYEDIIKQNGRTNGEVEIAHRIITESYENHMRNHTFVENIRGYDT